MTDFIHEHPKNETSAVPAVPSPAPAEETVPDEMTGQKRVYGYIFILFIVAFSLLVWSFFMNQRSTDQVLSELRGNANTLQSTLDRNIELEKRVEELENEVEALEESTRAQEKAAAALETAKNEADEHAAVRGLLWLLEYRLARGEYDLCRETVEQIEPLRNALQKEGNETYPSELERYNEILAVLAEQE